MSAAEVSREQLVEGLNTDLEHEYAAVIMYNTYAASVTGIHRKQLKAFFEEEVTDEVGHAQFLADKITALGGSPSPTAAAVKVVDNPRAMLEQVVKSEQQALERYVQRMKQAEAFGDYGLANDLHEIISDETRHKEEAEKILKGRWTE